MKSVGWASTVLGTVTTAYRKTGLGMVLRHSTGPLSSKSEAKSACEKRDWFLGKPSKFYGPREEMVVLRVG